MQKRSPKENIEYQEIIAEAKAGSYQPIRFSRVKYKDRPTIYIDIRKFQRGYEDSDHAEYHPTKVGFQFQESEFKKVVSQWTITPTQYVHPDVIDKSYDLLVRRKFESAVIEAYKCVEVLIRTKCGFSKDNYGVKLIRKAFDPQKGKLANMDLPISEREAMSNFVAGAFGVYRNPCSHREVDMEFLDAFEMIVIASNILKIAEKAPVNSADS